MRLHTFRHGGVSCSKLVSYVDGFFFTSFEIKGATQYPRFVQRVKTHGKRYRFCHAIWLLFGLYNVSLTRVRSFMVRPVGIAQIRLHKKYQVERKKNKKSSRETGSAGKFRAGTLHAGTRRIAVEKNLVHIYTYRCTIHNRQRFGTCTRIRKKYRTR